MFTSLSDHKVLVKPVRKYHMIPFWPKVDMDQRTLIDYTILMSDGEHPFTPTSREEIRQCLKTLKERDRIVMEINNVAG